MGSQKVRHNWATSLSTYIGSKSNFRISLQVQWLRLHASTAGCKGSIPVWGTKILHVTWCDQKLKKKINSFIIILNQADRLPISHKNDLPLTPFSYVMIQFLIWKHISLLLTVIFYNRDFISNLLILCISIQKTDCKHCDNILQWPFYYLKVHITSHSMTERLVLRKSQIKVAIYTRELWNYHKYHQ